MSEPIRYPATRRGDDAEDHHGEVVADPYRWLEDTDGAETRQWIASQNELTSVQLGSVADRDEIRRRLGEMWSFPRYGVPFERGGHWFQFRNAGLQNQSVLFVLDGPNSEGGRVLLDPNELSPDGTVAVSSLAVSRDGLLVAYSTSDGGSDWQTWHVREVESGRDRDDLIEWSRFSSASFAHDGSGFYYTAPEPPADPATALLAENRRVRVLFHRLGTDAREDAVVFDCSDEPEWLASATVTEDGRYLVVSIYRGTFPEAQLHVLDLVDEQSESCAVVDDFSALAEFVTNVGTTFYVLTSGGADRHRLVAIDLEDARGAGDPQWREVIGEREPTLVRVVHCGDKLVCHYLENARSIVEVRDFAGELVSELELPEIVSLFDPNEDPDSIRGRPGSPLIHFKLASFLESGAIWSHDLESGKTEMLRPSQAPFAVHDYVTELVFAASDDGTRVPMFVSRRRDLTPSGDVPVLMHGYGGFYVPMTPTFRVQMAVWMERGGIFAATVLRGGGEFGKAWHDAGRLANKQNVFDDFCACGRWFTDSGWSRPDRVAICGGSNGGLLVGACVTQHPEQFGAVVAEVGVFDMLRFHKFTIGWAWTSDFGDPEDPEQYSWSRAYSPLHNVVPGTAYPPMLIMTGDHDDRVVPGHSFKFAAALQSAIAGVAGAGPILLRVETEAGHGFGKPTSKQVEERVDVLSFLESALGLP